ncbi:hypothetical protein JKP88DRAFT_165000, partial [Tribonema minus]
IHRLVASSKASSKRRGMNQNELTTTIFAYICSAQKDRCIYSGLPVNFAMMTDSQASIERLDDQEDYFVENSALCALEFNTVAGWTAAKAKYAATHTDSVDAAALNANLRETLSKSAKYRARERMQQKEEEGVTLTRCGTCCAWKKQTDYYGDECTTCKACMNNNRKRYSANWRGALKGLVASASQSCKRPTSEARGLVCEITFEDVVGMYREQRGACMYSGIPLTTEGDWKVSLERRNVRIGYTCSN